MAIDNVRDGLDRFLRSVHMKVSRINHFVGETFVQNARASVTKTIYERIPDREPWELTGNLRNSIGYAASNEGNVSGKYGDGIGAAEAKKLAETGINENSLVLVAGMNYAQAVESRGYDVISNSANIAKKQHAMLIKKALKV